MTTTIQTPIRARRARREVRAALRSLTGRPVRVECEHGTPVRVTWPLPPAMRSAEAHAAAEEAATRLASWGDWHAEVESGSRRAVVRRLPDWPLLLDLDGTSAERTSAPVLGLRRTPDRLVPVRWDISRVSILSVTGPAGRGKTVLARAVAAQWPGAVFVLGYYDEWDARRYYRVLPRLSEALEVLDTLDEDAPAEPVLVIVDGLDDHVGRGATEDQIERLHGSLRRLAHVRGVRLLVTAHREEIAVSCPSLHVHAVAGAPRGRMVLRLGGAEIDVQVPWTGAPKNEGVSA